ncbi:unnamed protein product [Arctia plantaginis]|uniref:Uncharacterized protein n=1 Tax=Arctia plantaginis TaxID=874455 RepID=A0A8S1A8C5_ARCPL|nr:unnamed protein product [Arctia plantaginis]
MSIPAKADRKPPELFTVLGNMIIFAKSKYESYTKILETLKFIKMCFGEIEIADVGKVKNRKKERLCKCSFSSSRKKVS